MPNYERPDNENLFQIPINNIDPILSDANHILIQDVNSMIEDLFSIELNENNIQTIKNLIEDAKNISTHLRKYRLSDGKPFKSGKDRVDQFYKAYENRIKGGINRINDFLIEIANRQNIPAENDVTPEQTNAEIEVNQNFELMWEVIGFNRETLDFNVLKPFLSDYHVKQALNAHLKLHGPNQLEGVEYRKAIR